MISPLFLRIKQKSELEVASHEGVSVVMVGIDLIFGDGVAGGNLRKADELGSKEFVAG